MWARMWLAGILDSNMMAGWILILFIALVVLVFCADRFTHTATQLARLARLPEFVVGVTVVSIGTSLPELITSMAGVTSSSSEGAHIVVGTLIGSNIANILLIVGLAAVVTKKILLEHRIVELETVLLAMSAGFLVLTAMDGEITRIEGMFMVVGYVILALFALKQYKHSLPELKLAKTVHGWPVLISNLVFFGAGLGVAAWTVVRATTQVADLTGLATSTLAVTAIAIGTSLPELIVTLQAALKKQTGMAIGNIIGSNIFNVLALAGIPALFKALPVSSDMLYIGLPFFVAATLLYIFTGLSKRINAYEGSILLLLYAIFLGKIFHWF